MTTLEQALIERGISIYQMIKLLGDNPVSMFDHWNRKVRGKSTITYDDVKQICAVISAHSGKPIEPSDLRVFPNRITIR